MIPNLSTLFEPELLPLDTNEFRCGNNAERARLDVSGIGIWGPLERTFLDIRIVHPTSPTYENKSMQQIYSQNEKENKRSYNERIIQVEKAHLLQWYILLLVE